MQTTLHAAAATPSQKLAAAARRARAQKIAAQARPDSPIACPSASVRSQQVSASRPAPPQAAQASANRQKQMSAPARAWFWIVEEINPCTRMGLADIQAAVERHYGIAHVELISARRTAAVVRPRQLAMFLARHLTTHSLPVIGRKFGGRDHTTVLHAVRRIEALLSRDKTLAEDLDAITRQILPDHRGNRLTTGWNE